MYWTEYVTKYTIIRRGDTILSSRTSIISHLENEYTEPIRDPLWKHIYLSPGLLNVIEQEPFLALGKIRQLGVAYLVYPGATHTRFNHSLGVFHLAKRVIRALAAFPSCDWLSLEGVKAFLAAALLHDVGHFPFTHSFKDLPLKDHEKLTAELILSSPLTDVIRDKAGADPYFTAAIVDQSLDAGDSSELEFYRHILSGALDPDKLDYLNRDAYFCGVSYGIQDIDFIINRIIPHDKRGIALESSGLLAVESVLFSKYQMYRSVYWHKTVRIATAMIKKAIYLALRDGIIEKDDLYGLDDETFFSFLGAIPYDPFKLISRVASRQLLKTAYETSFSELAHGGLTDLTSRTAAEEEIARRIAATTGRSLPPYLVILDIPEPISFEIDIPVHENGRLLPYPEAGSVFTRPVVEGFTRVLRRVRLILPAEILDLINSPEELLPWT